MNCSPGLSNLGRCLDILLDILVLYSKENDDSITTTSLLHLVELEMDLLDIIHWSQRETLEISGISFSAAIYGNVKVC